MIKKLNDLKFELKAENPIKYTGVPYHYGVVGSGDMELIISPKELNGGVSVLLKTPVSGFDRVWELVLKRFVETTHIGDALIEINDNNSTPAVVSLRLNQALIESKGGK